MESWQEIRQWRQATRAELLAQRLSVSRGEKRRVRSVLHDRLGGQFPELRHACIGFCWPFKGEIDLRHLVQDALALGAEAALPVVVEKRQPLQFRKWHPRMKLVRGIWDIPVPAEPNVVRPTVLLIPLVGFDTAGYRLGYGGGYYDRTLATMDSRPLTIGVGYELGRLETIYPQPHDIPLDAIVTEAGSMRFRHRGEALRAMGRPDAAPMRQGTEYRGACLREAPLVDDSPESAGDNLSTYASPPCFMHELDPACLGYMSTPETVTLLNHLLEDERAAARSAAAMAREMPTPPGRAILKDIARDETRICTMLSHHIIRHGGTPSPQTGPLHGKLIALDTRYARIDLLMRHQDWVLRTLQGALSRIGDDTLHDDLKDMRDLHERNVKRCADLR